MKDRQLKLNQATIRHMWANDLTYRTQAVKELEMAGSIIPLNPAMRKEIIGVK